MTWPEIVPGFSIEISWRQGETGTGSILPKLHSAGKTGLPSIGLRQPENFLGDEAENELRRHRGQFRDHHFPEIALDMILPGVTVAAVGRDRGLAGFEAGFGG